MNRPVRILYLEDNPRDAELACATKLQQTAMAHELRVVSHRRHTRPHWPRRVLT